MDTLNNNLGFPGSLIKEKYLEELQSDFRILSEIVLNQIALTQQLLENKFDKEVLSRIARNEKIIDSLDLTIRGKSDKRNYSFYAACYRSQKNHGLSRYYHLDGKGGRSDKECGRVSATNRSYH